MKNNKKKKIVNLIVLFGDVIRLLYELTLKFKVV